MKSYKYHINGFVYGLLYPGFLGSMIYELMLPPQVVDGITTQYWSAEKFIMWLITIFYCLDYFHLYGDIDRRVPLKNRTPVYFICDITVSLLFFGAFITIKPEGCLLPIILISLVPACFLIYKLQLGIDKKFHWCYFGGSILALLYFGAVKIIKIKIPYPDSDEVFLLFLLSISLLFYLVYIFFIYEEPKIVSETKSESTTTVVVSNNKEKLTLQEVSDYSDSFSTGASKLVRQLSIAGIAVAWAFLYNKDKGSTDGRWIWPVMLFAFSILMDLAHYTVAFYILRKTQKEGFTTRVLNADSDEDKKKASYEVNANPIVALFWLKMICVTAAYIVLIVKFF